MGTQVFPLIETRFATTLKGQQAIFLVGSGICVVGAIIVMTLVPNGRAQLEDEDVEFGKYLEETDGIRQTWVPWEGSCLKRWLNVMRKFDVSIALLIGTR